MIKTKEVRSLPACPQLKRNLAEPSQSISFIKGSSFNFQAAETEGNHPHLFSEPNLEEPSLLKEAENKGSTVKNNEIDYTDFIFTLFLSILLEKQNEKESFLEFVKNYLY